MPLINTRAGTILSGVLVASGAIATIPANAQTTNSRVAATTGLEEIIVTARKREESLQQVPVAVTAITSEQLREQNIKDAYDLQFHTPGLMMRSGAGSRSQADFFIRGQGATFGSAAAVAVYFAEAPVAPAAVGGLGDNGQFFDLANVQVLKGPQGTLFGRSTTGGAVLYSPARPTDQFEASVQASVGNLGFHEFTGFVNVPVLGDKVALRVSANSVRRDGFTTSTTTQQQLDDRHRDSFRLGLSVKPIDWFENYTMFQDNKASETGTGAVLLVVNPKAPLFNPAASGPAIGAICSVLNSANPAAIPGCIGTRSARLAATYQGLLAQQARIAGEDEDEVRRTGTGVIQGLSGHTQQLVNITTVKAGEIPFLGDLSFKNIFSTNKSYGVKTLRDLAGSPLPAAIVWTSADIRGFVPTYNNDIAKGKNDWLDYFTDEFQIAGTINNKHNWLLGTYYERNKTDLAYPPIFSTFGDVLSTTTNTPSPVGGFTSDRKSVVKGYFGQFTLDLSDWVLNGLRFTAGYRWSIQTLRSVSLAATKPTFLVTPGGTIPLPFTLPNLDANGNLIPGAASPAVKLDDQAPSWNFSFDYRITDQLLTYIATRRGFKPGGINVGFNPAVAGSVATFTPETLDDVELGAKWDWNLGDVRGRTNSALYGQRYSNIQRAQFLPTASGSVVQQTNNIATAEIWGFELENLFQLTDHLQVNLTYAYIHPKYTKWPGDSNGPLVAGGTPLIDSPYPGTPKNQGTLGVRYTLPLGGLGDLIPSAEYYRQSSVELNDSALQDNHAVPPEPGYGNLNLRMDWLNIAGLSLDAGLWVRNATDDVHKVAVNSLYGSAGFISALYNEPRTYGVEFRYHIGGSH